MLHFSPRFSLKGAIASLVACFFIVSIASDADAQSSRFSLGLGGGASIPLSASDRYVPRFADLDYAGSEAPTLLRNFHPSSGFLFNFEVLVRDFSIRYNFQRFGWNKDSVSCVPHEDNTYNAVLLPNGEYDDLGMLYSCSGSYDRITAEESRPAYSVHEISGTREWTATDYDSFYPYLSAGAGVLITSFQTSAQDNSYRFGAVVLAGGGVRVPIDPKITLFLEAKYALHLMARSGDYGLRANRAVAADQTIFGTLIDPLHAIRIGVGIRVHIR